jgi:hypothetical protein
VFAANWRALLVWRRTAAYDSPKRGLITSGDIMKHLLPLPLIALLALLLSGCPDAKLPSPPPNVPVPKAAGSALLNPAGQAGPVTPLPGSGWVHA